MILFLVAVYPNGKQLPFLLQKIKKEEIYMRLVIAEKPSMAMSIAAVIGADERKRSISRTASVLPDAESGMKRPCTLICGLSGLHNLSL